MRVRFDLLTTFGTVISFLSEMIRSFRNARSPPRRMPVFTAAPVGRRAEADAVRSLRIDRRQALWEAKALRDAPDLPLFREGRDEGETPVVPLPAMPLAEQVVADDQTLRPSLRRTRWPSSSAACARRASSPPRLWRRPASGSG